MIITEVDLTPGHNGAYLRDQKQATLQKLFGPLGKKTLIKYCMCRPLYFFPLESKYF